MRREIYSEGRVMVQAQLRSLVRHLHRLTGEPDETELSDRQLLARFVSDRDESAFAALVRRHGGLVLGLCWRVLHNADGVEDAFQATFLVLARKAAALRVGWSLRTLKRRLARGLERLRGRLTRRGLSLSAGLLAAALSQNAANAAVSPSLTVAATRAASSEAVSPSVSALAEGVLK